MKGLKSIFLKNFVIYSLVVMLSFTALGGAFIYQINRYSAEERQSILNSTARRAEESTANYMVNQSNVMGFSRELLESSFHLNMMQLAGNLGGVTAANPASPCRRKACRPLYKRAAFTRWALCLAC